MWTVSRVWAFSLCMISLKVKRSPLTMEETSCVAIMPQNAYAAQQNVATAICLSLKLPLPKATSARTVYQVFRINTELFIRRRDRFWHATLCLQCVPGIKFLSNFFLNFYFLNIFFFN
jgi:hypothetical protein